MVRNCVLFLLSVWGLCGETRADCIAELFTVESEFLRCASDLARSLQSVDPNNPHNFCTGDVKKHMTCFIGYLEQCPALTKDGAMFGHVMPGVRDFEAVCTRTKACPGLTSCLGGLTLRPDIQPSGIATPFSLLQTIILVVCRYFKHQLDCLDTHRATCPAVVRATEDMLSSSIKNYYVAKLLNMDLDQVKAIIADQCPGIPAEFPTNTCVREKLEGIGFLKCIGMVEKLSKEAPKGEQCKFYFDGKACIEDHIGKPCGQENAKVIVDTAPLVIHDLPQNCEKPKTVSIQYSTTAEPLDHDNSSGIQSSTTTRPLDRGNSSGIQYSTTAEPLDHDNSSGLQSSTTAESLDQSNSSGIHADGDQNHGNTVSAPIIVSIVLLCMVACFAQMF